MERIVVVEDEVYIREELMDILTKAGYEAVGIDTFADTVEEIRKSAPDLVLLDLNLPGSSGFAVAGALKDDKTYPVLVLTSRDQVRDEIQALNLGADDYLTKPVHTERLLARIANLLRRFSLQRQLLRAAQMTLDTHTYTLYAEGKSLVLPENEGKILETLMRAGGQVVSKEDLFLAVWGTQEYVDENILQVNITRLRKALGRIFDRDKIRTVRGVGYRLV